MGFSPEVEQNLTKIMPDTYGALSPAGKEEFFNSYMALPPEKQQAVAQQAGDLVNQYTAAQQTDNSNFVQDAYRNVLGRDAETEGLGYWSDKLSAGETKDAVIAGMKASAEGQTTTAAASASDANRYDLDKYSPVYGTKIGGMALPGTPDLSSIARPADLQLTDYGTAVNGFDDYLYGDTIRGKTLAEYGDTLNGKGPANYDEDVTNPMHDWQYQESDAFKAKNSLTQEALMNSMAKRGIRGATTAGAAADQTRKLINEDYTNERAYQLNQLIQKYQAHGMEYEQAYAAATNEYNAMYGAANAEYTTALNSVNSNATAENASAWQGYGADRANLLDQYSLDLGAYTDMYKNRTNEANASYDKIINDIKIGQNAAGSVGTAGTNAANNISSSLNAAGAASANAANAAGAASASLYSGMGNASANFFANPSVQKGLGNIWESMTAPSYANMAANGTAIGSIAAPAASTAATSLGTNYTGSAALNGLGYEAADYADLL